MTTTTASTNRLNTAAPAGTVRARRAIAVGGAVAAALVVWVVAVPMLGVDLRAAHGSNGTNVHTVGPGSIVGVTLLVSLLGWAALHLLERRTARAARIWTIVAVAVLVASLGGPLSAGVGTESKATLIALHLAVGAAIIWPLRHTSSTRR